jgi:predicted dithiol-disulfide oxidoreductase (DUF899 family)
MEVEMALPDVVTREQWLAARTELLAAEKEATRSRDALNTRRRQLPMVRIDKDYKFDGEQGTVPLTALFGDSRQLIIQHVMFDPAWDAACPGCTASVDEISDGMLRHLLSRDTAFALVSRAPLAKLQQYQASRGWTVPWYSSEHSDFNYDFQVTVDKDHPEYNYRMEPELAASAEPEEVPGFSCFLRDGGQVFHTYSAYARGTDTLGSSYSLLDLTALGRQEDWEQPAGRAPRLHGADPTFTD